MIHADIEREFDPALTEPGLTSEAVEALIALNDEPSWRADGRRAAWAAYQRLPMPTRKDERWRFTNLRGLDVDGIVPFTACDNFEAALDAANHSLLAGGKHAVRAVAANNAMWDGSISVTELPDGVVVEPLCRAIERYGALVERWLGHVAPITDSVDDKFLALNEALSSSGLFVHVPRGVTVPLPIAHTIVHAVASATIMPRTVIVLEEGARATFVEEYLSLEDDLDGFSNSVVEIVVGDGARLDYVVAQHYSERVAHFATHRVFAGRDAQVEWATIGLGGERGKSRMEAHLRGPGANVRLTGAYLGDGAQMIDYDTRQLHEAPNASSDLAFKGVLAGRSRAVWRGTIDVAEGAQGTDAYQDNRNLLLSSGAHADSIPGLQIEANDVRCTHGSTIGKVDPEQLFYLMSRGMTRAQATREIVRGFFVPVLERIPDGDVRESVRIAIWQRLDAARA